jgi:hypothetical protein
VVDHCADVASPNNRNCGGCGIGRRSSAAVRERGLSLLRQLHTDDNYDRVIVIGHSLGPILAYDIVAYFWQSWSVDTMLKTALAK